MAVTNLRPFGRVVYSLSGTFADLSCRGMRDKKLNRKCQYGLLVDKNNELRFSYSSPAGGYRFSIATKIESGS